MSSLSFSDPVGSRLPLTSAGHTDAFAAVQAVQVETPPAEWAWLYETQQRRTGKRSSETLRTDEEALAMLLATDGPSH